MTKLTPKQEKFCQGIVSGKSQADAWRAAYTVGRMQDKTIHEAASRLIADSKVLARIAEIQGPVLAKVRVTREQWLDKMQAFFFADVRKMFSGPGNALDISELGENEALMIEGFELVENFEKVGEKAEHVGYTKKYKLTPKLKALLEFGKVMGWYEEKNPDHGPTTIIIRKFVNQEVQHVQHITHGNDGILDGVRDRGAAATADRAGAGVCAMENPAPRRGGQDRPVASPAECLARPAASPRRAVGAEVSEHLQPECVPAAAEQPVPNGIRRRLLSSRVPVKKTEEDKH